MYNLQYFHIISNHKNMEHIDILTNKIQPNIEELSHKNYKKSTNTLFNKLNNLLNFPCKSNN